MQVTQNHIVYSYKLISHYTVYIKINQTNVYQFIQVYNF